MFCLHPSERGKSFTSTILLRNESATSVIACFSVKLIIHLILLDRHIDACVCVCSFIGKECW